MWWAFPLCGNNSPCCRPTPGMHRRRWPAQSSRLRAIGILTQAFRYSSFFWSDGISEYLFGPAFSGTYRGSGWRSCRRIPIVLAVWVFFQMRSMRFRCWLSHTAQWSPARSPIAFSSWEQRYRNSKAKSRPWPSYYRS